MARILHVLDHSLPLHSGYTFRTRAIMRAQAARGWDVAGLTGLRHGSNGGSNGGVEGEAESVDGLRFYRTSGEVSAPSPFREWREIARLSDRIVALHRQWRFDLIHAHSPVLNGLAALRAASRLGVPLLYEIRAFWEDAAVGNGTGQEGSARYRLTRALESHVARATDGVAVICKGLKTDLLERGIAPGKIMVSPNGVDMKLFGDPPPRDAALAADIGLGDGPVLGFIGSFYDYEGLDDLVAAMPAILAQAPATRLLLVGGGPREAALRAQVAASTAADHIHFIGRVPHEQVERYYALTDILVYPRKRLRLTELVTPLKPLEAMAQGRLVAASNVGGHRELIEDNVTGTLFAPDDPAALALSVGAMLADRAGWNARRAAARAFVERERSWSRNILRYEPVYHLLLGDGAIERAA